MNGPTRDRLESLLSALIDERLSEDQIEELNFLLRDDPENRRFYLHYMDIQSRLSIDPDESTTTMDWRGILS